MNSGGHRFFTVVTIVTLIFGPVFSHHKWVYELVSQTSETHNVQCVVNKPCPKQKTIVTTVYQPLPTSPPKKAKDAKDVKDGKGRNSTSPADLTSASAP